MFFVLLPTTLTSTYSVIFVLKTNCPAQMNDGFVDGYYSPPREGNASFAYSPPKQTTPTYQFTFLIFIWFMFLFEQFCHNIFYFLSVECGLWLWIQHHSMCLATNVIRFRSPHVNTTNDIIELDLSSPYGLLPSLQLLIFLHFSFAFGDGGARLLCFVSWEIWTHLFCIDTKARS